MRSAEPFQGLAVAILFVILVALGPLLYLHSSWLKEIENQERVQIHLSTLKEEAMTAHLWFEEWLGGDPHIDLDEQVWAHFSESQRQLELFNSGQRELDSEALHHIHGDQGLTIQKQVDKLEVQLNEVVVMARERSVDKERFSAGSDIDEDFDVIYEGALDMADSIEAACTDFSTVKMKSRHQIHDLTLTLWALGSLGTAVGLVYLTRRRKRIEEEKKVLEGRFQQAQKLESLGVLAGGIAHDFNNLLMAIAGNTSLLLLEEKFPKGLRSSLEEIDSGVHKAAALTSQMLAYAGKGKFIETIVDFNTLIAEMGALLSLSISKRVVVNYQLSDDPLAIKGNPTQLQQVVMNLLINASEASEDTAGTISVETTVQELEESEIEDVSPDSEDFSAGKYIVFAVTDTGMGMSDDVQSRCFEPFFSTKFTGRGLGLAAVLGIVRAHGGAIQLESTADVGTTFRVFFPLSGEEIVPKARQEVQEIIGSVSGEILVIDDDPSVRKIVERMLSKVGFAVEIAGSGEEGLAILAKKEDQFDIVLVDMEMPGINGETVGRTIRERKLPVKVVLSSGYSEDTVLSPGENLFDAFIQKPYRVQELWKTLTIVLDGN